jgi:recombinational DNA repair protein RecT
MTKEKKMTKELTLVEKLGQSPLLTSILGTDKDRYIRSVVAEIYKTKGDDKKDLTLCTPSSIAEAIKQACDLKLEIDGRQHCHLIKYGVKATIQVGYRGFIFAIKRAYPDANIDCSLVYKGDEFKVTKEGDVTTYLLERGNPFAPKTEIIGGFCYISYTLGGRLVSFCETMSLDEINKIKGCAKQAFIWNQWFEEKAKVAIIKRACKVHFSGINDDIGKIEQYDNQEFEMEKEMKVVKEVEIIDSEKAFEIERLIEKAEKDKDQIFAIYGVSSAIQLSVEDYKLLKESLDGNN